MAWFQRKNADIRDTDHPAVVDADVPTDLSIQRVYDDRMQCYHHLNQVLSSVQKQSKGVVLKLYIENFKQLNDVFGYSYSENLLTQIISYLKEKTKTAVYQYIGMEFIVILEGYTQGQAISLADEILAQFDSVWRVDDTDCLCSVQIGMCSYNDAKLSVDDLLKYLDLAISKAGEGGPNQAMMYNSSLHDQFLRRQTIARYLKTAIDNHEIEVRYRPTYHIEKQRFTRAEFYMRIFIKGIGLIGKSEFIPIAEDSGQIRSLEYFALEQVGSCIAELITAGKEFDSISLPISSVLLLQEDFLDKIRELIDKYQIPQGKLALEINESALTMAYLNINIVMQDLSDLGIEII
ncbi:MAG: EAL domain-containing protein, partial [Hungatella sp.]